MGCVINDDCDDVIDDYDENFDDVTYYCLYHYCFYSSLQYSLPTPQAIDKNHTNNTNYFVQAKPSTSSRHDIKADTNTIPYDK